MLLQKTVKKRQTIPSFLQINARPNDGLSLRPFSFSRTFVAFYRLSLFNWFTLARFNYHQFSRQRKYERSHWLRPNGLVNHHHRLSGIEYDRYDSCLKLSMNSLKMNCRCGLFFTSVGFNGFFLLLMVLKVIQHVQGFPLNSLTPWFRTTFESSLGSISYQWLQK